MCIHNHFLRFSRAGNDKYFAAEGKTKMGRFNDLFDTAYFNDLLTPIKLTDIPWFKNQGNKSLFYRRRIPALDFPLLKETLRKCDIS